MADPGKDKDKEKSDKSSKLGAFAIVNRARRNSQTSGRKPQPMIGKTPKKRDTHDSSNSRPESPGPKTGKTPESAREKPKRDGLRTSLGGGSVIPVGPPSKNTLPKLDFSASEEDGKLSTRQTNSPRKISGAESMRYTLDPDGLPKRNPNEFRIYSCAARFANFPNRPTDTLADILKKVITMWPQNMLKLGVTPCTDMVGNVLSITSTLGELGVNEALFGITLANWKKEFLDRGADVDSTPRNGAQSTRSSSPRVRTVRIYLPAGTQSILPWDGEKTVGQVLREVCNKRGIDMEGKVPCNTRNGKQLDMDAKLGDLGITEITFGTTLATWAQEASMVNVDRTTSYEVGTSEARRLKVILPGNDTSVRPWQHDINLRDALEAVMEMHALSIESIVIKNEKTGEKLEWFKTLGEQDVDEVRLVDTASVDTNRMFRIYFIGGQQSSQVYDPAKTVQKVLDKLFSSRPDLSTKLKVFDSNGETIVPTALCRHLPTQSLYYGETPSQWHKRKGKEETPAPTTVKTEKDFSVYYPGAKFMNIPYKQPYLTMTLAEIIRSKPELEAIRAEPTDLDGVVLDTNMRLIDISKKVLLLKIVLGVTMRDWTLDFFINRILPGKPLSEWDRQQTGIANSGFKVYLPDGQVSNVPYDQSKSLKEVFNRLAASRAGFEDFSFVPTDIEGNELPMSMTLAEIPGRVVCYGPDIVEWVMSKDKESKMGVKSEGKKQFSNFDRIRFVESLFSKLGASDQVLEKADEWVCVEETPPHWYLQNADQPDKFLSENFRASQPLYSWDYNCPFRFSERSDQKNNEENQEGYPNVLDFDDSSDDGGKGFSEWWAKQESQVLETQKEFEQLAITMNV